ncbi:M3 family metallopeptidase [Alteromonas gracilis]
MSLPDPLTLPTDAAAWGPWLEERARGGLRTAADHVGALKAAPEGDVSALHLWNDAGIALSDVFSVCSLMSAVHPDAAVMELAEQLEVEATRFSTDLYLDAGIHDRLAAVRLDERDADAARVLEHALRDFRHAGVDRDEATRARLRELSDRMTELDQAFSRTIRDGRRTTRVPAEALASLPADYREAHPAAADGMVEISTDYPDTHPFLAQCDDAAAREAVATTYLNLGWPDNDAVLAELLDLRQEKAELLGYASWPDYDAEVKMIGSGDAIGEFIDRIAAEAAPAAERDLEQILTRAREAGEESLTTANSRYWVDRVGRELHDIDHEQVRRHFDFAKVSRGLLEVTARLFGIAYVPVEEPAWHVDVESYDVYLDGARIGRIHLDLHPRERKYNHAAQFSLVEGIRGRQLAEGVLVCNFSRGLMEHQEVVTLFHEFGHLMHHVLAGQHDWVRFAGVATEWDFVEAPSQMLEEWAWDPEVLALFATDAEGTPIPADLVARMRAAEDFGRGIHTRTQMFYAAISYRFHRDRPADRTAAMLELQAAYAVTRPLPDTHFFTGFGHLTGYSSGYYTYMWSQVIAKDLFSAFDSGDLFAPDVARRYRDLVLAPGGSKDAADLVEDFLGRPYDTAAFSAWLAG